MAKVSQVDFLETKGLLSGKRKNGVINQFIMCLIFDPNLLRFVTRKCAEKLILKPNRKLFNKLTESIDGKIFEY